MTCHWVCNKSDTMGAISGAGHALHSGAHAFTVGFSLGWCCSLVFYVMLCRSLFDLFPLVIILFVFLLFIASDYHFDIFKFVLQIKMSLHIKIITKFYMVCFHVTIMTYHREQI